MRDTVERYIVLKVVRDLSDPWSESRTPHDVTTYIVYEMSPAGLLPAGHYGSLKEAQEAGRHSTTI
jgi:hypothetical protein